LSSSQQRGDREKFQVKGHIPFLKTGLADAPAFTIQLTLKIAGGELLIAQIKVEYPAADLDVRYLWNRLRERSS